MSDTLIAAIIQGFFGLVLAVVAGYVSVAIARMKTTVTEVKQIVVDSSAVVAKTQEIAMETGRKTDGQLSELVAEVRAVADAAGFARGVAVTQSATDESARIAAKSAQDRAEGLAEGRAEIRPPSS